MREWVRYLYRNQLLKIAGFNSIHIAIRIVTGGVMSWVIAHLLGTSGMAVMGNFRNFFQAIQNISVLGMENGLVRYAAQFKNDGKELSSYFSVAYVAAILTSVALATVLYTYAIPLDQYLIGLETTYDYVFKVLAVAIPFYVLFTLIVALLQGMEWYRKFIWINITVSLIVFGLSIVLIYQYSLAGALLAMVATPVIQCVVAVIIWINLKKEISLRKLLTARLDISKLRPLLSYSSMALLSALLIPITYIAVRQDLRGVVGDTAAGNWEGLQRISGYYMMFVTSLISLYVLPQLSKNDSILNYRATVGHFYKTMSIPVSLGLLAIFFSRSMIVRYLFTEEFVGMLPMYKWQLAGDFIKIIATVLAFRFIAINDLKRYAIAEVISLATFFIANYALIRIYGSEGVVMAHLASHCIYLMTVLFLLRRELTAN